MPESERDSLEEVHEVPAVTKETAKRNQRWYDSSRMIWGLFSVIGLILFANIGVIWASVTSANSKNNVQDVKIQRVETLIETMDGRIEKIEKAVNDQNRKLDQILLRLPK